MFVAPPIEGVMAELLVACSIIAVGIWLEGRMSRKYVFLNLMGLLVIAITTRLDLLVVPLLTFYLILGVVIAYYKKEGVYFLFGSKAYGSLLLALAFIHMSNFQEGLSLFYKQLPLIDFLEIFYATLLILWGVSIIFVLVFAKVIKNNRRRR